MMYSKNPATSEIVWQGRKTTSAELSDSIHAAKIALTSWAKQSVEDRALLLKRFQTKLKEHSHELATMISQEMGKPLWESLTEVQSMQNKVDISILAYNERCPTRSETLDRSITTTRHFPHGVAAVFGAYNFPGHLPNGHIVPALLAGNTCLFKPSELTPGTGELMADLWKKAGLPPGVFNLVQGGKSVGKKLVQLEDIRGIFFTGSVPTGQAILKQSAKMPWRMVALEMGGNNPLILSKVADKKAALFNIIQSAFITTGQRCSCARRLIVIENNETESFLHDLVAHTKKLKIGAYTDTPEPYMGPLATKEQAAKVLFAFQGLQALQGKVLLEMNHLDVSTGFVTPGIIDMTGIQVQDVEIFGPLLQIIRVKNLKEAISQANNTEYGLTAGILTDSHEEWHEVLHSVHAGVINWNTPLTGASSKAPFGGLGKSGNFRPSAYYAADYVAYPVASQEALKAHLPPQLPPGFPNL